MAVDRGNSAFVRVWSDAIFGLAESRGVADEMLAEWEGLVEVLDRHPDLWRFFASPLVDREEKKRLIETMFRGRASDLLVDSLQVMRSKDRLALVRGVAADFRVLWLEKRNQVQVSVTSAAPLTPEQRQDVNAAASKFAGKQAILIEKVDPTLLGGFVLRVGDRKFDG